MPIRRVNIRDIPRRRDIVERLLAQDDFRQRNVGVRTIRGYLYATDEQSLFTGYCVLPGFDQKHDIIANLRPVGLHGINLFVTWPDWGSYYQDKEFSRTGKWSWASPLSYPDGWIDMTQSHPILREKWTFRFKKPEHRMRGSASDTRASAFEIRASKPSLMEF